MGKLGDAAAPSWSALGRAHRVEYVFLAATLVLLAFSEGWHPYKRHFYTGWGRGPVGVRGGGGQVG